MQRVVAEHPDDLDAPAFGALASMFAEYVGDLSPEQSAAARERAIALAEHVFEKQPRHPGGTHYLIHATDDPRFASRGLPAARMYSVQRCWKPVVRAKRSQRTSARCKLTPGRSSALLGLARAHAATGDRAAAADAYRALLDNWQHADADLAVLDEVGGSRRQLRPSSHRRWLPTRFTGSP